VQTFSADDGVGAVQVRCTGPTSIQFEAATPSNGYSVRVDSAGPDEVRVEFRSNGDSTDVRVACVGGTAQRETDG